MSRERIIGGAFVGIALAAVAAAIIKDNQEYQDPSKSETHIEVAVVETPILEEISLPILIPEESDEYFSPFQNIIENSNFNQDIEGIELGDFTDKRSREGTVQYSSELGGSLNLRLQPRLTWDERKKCLSDFVKMISQDPNLSYLLKDKQPDESDAELEKRNEQFNTRFTEYMKPITSIPEISIKINQWLNPGDILEIKYKSNGKGGLFLGVKGEEKESSNKLLPTGDTFRYVVTKKHVPGDRITIKYADWEHTESQEEAPEIFIDYIRRIGNIDRPDFSTPESALEMLILSLQGNNTEALYSCLSSQLQEPFRDKYNQVRGDWKGEQKLGMMIEDSIDVSETLEDRNFRVTETLDYQSGKVFRITSKDKETLLYFSNEGEFKYSGTVSEAELQK